MPASSNTQVLPVYRGGGQVPSCCVIASTCRPCGLRSPPRSACPRTDAGDSMGHQGFARAQQELLEAWDLPPILGYISRVDSAGRHMPGGLYAIVLIMRSWLHYVLPLRPFCTPWHHHELYPAHLLLLISMQKIVQWRGLHVDTVWLTSLRYTRNIVWGLGSARGQLLSTAEAAGLFQATD